MESIVHKRLREAVIASRFIQLCYLEVIGRVWLSLESEKRVDSRLDRTFKQGVTNLSPALSW